MQKKNVLIASRVSCTRVSMAGCGWVVGVVFGVHFFFSLCLPLFVPFLHKLLRYIYTCPAYIPHAKQLIWNVCSSYFFFFFHFAAVHSLRISFISFRLFCSNWDYTECCQVVRCAMSIWFFFYIDGRRRPDDGEGLPDIFSAPLNKLCDKKKWVC